MQLIYGGSKAIKVTNQYFVVVTKLAGKLKEQTTDEETWHRQVLSQSAYLYPIFCVQMGITPSDTDGFSTYLFDSWYPGAINQNGYLMPDEWLTKKEGLKKELYQRVSTSDPDLLPLTKAIMSDPEIRFDVEIFDEWADGLAAVSDQLHALADKEHLQTYRSDHLDERGMWSILRHYLDHLYGLLDVPHKDRLYLILLLKQALTI